MRDVAVDGRTVLFVSHNMSLVSQITNRALYLLSGELAAVGPTDEVLRTYRAAAGAHAAADGEYRITDADRWNPAGLGREVEILALRLLDGQPRLEAESDLRVQLRLRARVSVPAFRAHVGVLTVEGLGVCAAFSDESIGMAAGESKDVVLRMPNPHLAPGSYQLEISVGHGDHFGRLEHFDVVTRVGALRRGGADPRRRDRRARVGVRLGRGADPEAARRVRDRGRDRVGRSDGRGYVSRPPLPALVEDLRTVEGWLSDEDVALFLAVDDAAQALGIRGDLLEIGAYKGKSAVVLGYCLADEERLVVVDPFGRSASDATVLAEQHRFYEDLTRSEFDRNYARFHARPPVVLERFSTDLEPGDIGRDLRLVHVDGAHDYASVAHDVDLVLAVLADDGILVFDDAMDRGAPGVVAAVWEAVGDGRLIPVMTTGKVWTCRPEAHPRLLAALEHQLSTSAVLTFVKSVIRGAEVLQVSPLSLAPPRSRSRRVAHLMTPPAAYLARDQIRSLAQGRFGSGAREKTEP